jgi:hypothetical protein
VPGLHVSILVEPGRAVVFPDDFTRSGNHEGHEDQATKVTNTIPDDGTDAGWVDLGFVPFGQNSFVTFVNLRVLRGYSFCGVGRRNLLHSRP